MIYEAILFDMDGVIIDTHQAVTEFWKEVAHKHGVSLTPDDFEQHIYGCPATHTFALLFPHLNADEKHAVFSKMMDLESTMSYTPVNGAIELVSRLKQKAIPTALVTSADQWKVQAVLSQLNLEGIFSVQVTVKDIRNGKPHPDCYLQAARKLGRLPERCIVFEDAISGVKAAIASGALCIGVQRPELASGLLKAGARYVVSDLQQVTLQEPQGETNGLPDVLQIGTECALSIGNVR